MPSKSKAVDTANDQTGKHLDTINGQLKQYGILFESAKQYPSVVGTIIGNPVQGSWWGHPKGMLVYNVLKQFSIQPDVLTAKLLDGKTTFVHRSLWPMLLTVANSGEPWQTNGMSKDEKRLYEAVVAKGQLRTDEYSKTARLTVGALGKTARELEKRLLVYGEGFHSNIGSHAKRLETWDHWAAGRKYALEPVQLEVARSRLEAARKGLGATSGKIPMLPWELKRPARKAS